MDPKTDTPKPAAWYDNPLVKHIAGIALAIALGLLSSRFGITPQPLPTFPQAAPPVVLVFADGHGVGHPVSVAEKK